MNTKDIAVSFARRWYNRTLSGCDEETLALLLQSELDRVVMHVQDKERERLLSKLAQNLT